ncbi:MFS transporter [Glycomyces buryatensis]|uniref:MFS transporter n=1 Tax=Glycomyces buryatensis TaxID=2570927 RepID=A0A4S8QM87_9ACTN|nr:MFS transporter [Glycomyces buryatensis]THV41844.1 MFS transporter [Glycomyces buryatensis]
MTTTAESTAPAAAAGTPERTQWGAILTLGFAQLIVAGGMSTLAVALPSIRSGFAVTEAATAWVLLAYALPMGAVAIAAGRLADKADLRAVAVLAMGGLAIFSAASALAPTFGLLIAARAAQGLIGGLLFGMTGKIVVTAATQAQRGRALSAITLLMTIGAMGIGAAGGLIIAATSWRGLLWVFFGLAAVAALALAATVPSNGTGLPRFGREFAVDIATSGGAIVAFLMSFEYLDTDPWISLGALATSVALGWLWTRQRTSAPTVALLRRPVMAAALVSLTLMSAVAGLLNFGFPYLLNDVYEVRPELISLALLAFIGGVAVTTPIGGVLADRFGAGRISMVGAGLVLAALVPLLLVGENTGLVDLAVRIGLLGLAFGIFNTPMNAHLLASAPPEQAGTAGAFMATTRTVGTSLGPVIAALMWSLASTPLDGYRLSALAIAAILVLGTAAMATAKPWRATANA